MSEDREASPEIPRIDIGQAQPKSTWSASQHRDPSAPVVTVLTKAPAAAATANGGSHNASLNSSVRPRATANVSVRSSTLMRTHRAGGGSTGGAAGPRPAVAPTGPTPRPADLQAPSVNTSKFGMDVTKYVKEIARRKNEGVFLRVLPKVQQLVALVVQEEAARGQALAQEQTGRLQIENKRAEEGARKQEQQLAAANKTTQDALKVQQQQELAGLRESVTADLKNLDQEIKDRLKLLALLQPRLNVPNAVLADLKNESCDYALLGSLLEEEKKVLKGIKMDARYNKTKTAEQDGGAVPYWHKHALAASFNVAAILKQSSLRAAVEDAAGVTGRNLGDKKMIVVRDEANPAKVIAWAHTRSGPDGDALAAAFLAATPTPTELPAAAGQGVIMPKDEYTELVRKARMPKSEIADIAPLLTAALTVDGLSTHEFTTKDVATIGETAAV